MNQDEKRALWGFITIYTLSSLLLMAIIAILYYNKEVTSQKRTCKKDLQETIMMVELELLKKEILGEKFVFSSSNYPLSVGLYNNKKESLQSNLKYLDIDFNEHMSVKKNRIHRIKKLQNPIQNISYIVAEDEGMPTNIKNLKYIILMTILLSSVFIAFIGYLLSRLLLKPINKKIKQIDRFIKDSAHEINTPVTALLMSVSALKKKGIKDDKLLRHISISSKQISQSYNALSHIAFNDIKNSDKIVKFDLRKEVIKSIAFFKEIAEVKDIKIIDNLNSCYIQLDREDAAKLINNLLSNAIKYSYNGKKIEVTLKNYKLTIKDEGIGIEQEDKDEILERYTRATTQVGGFGIGLDIVNSICKKYNILLFIESKVENGSTFVLDFSRLKEVKK